MCDLSPRIPLRVIRILAWFLTPCLWVDPSIAHALVSCESPGIVLGAAHSARFQEGALILPLGGVVDPLIKAIKLGWTNLDSPFSFGALRAPAKGVSRARTWPRDEKITDYLFLAHRSEAALRPVLRGLAAGTGFFLGIIVLAPSARIVGPLGMGVRGLEAFLAAHPALRWVLVLRQGLGFVWGSIPASPPLGSVTAAAAGVFLLVRYVARPMKAYIPGSRAAVPFGSAFDEAAGEPRVAIPADASLDEIREGQRVLRKAVHGYGLLGHGTQTSSLLVLDTILTSGYLHHRPGDVHFRTLSDEAAIAGGRDAGGGLFIRDPGRFLEEGPLYVDRPDASADMSLRHIDYIVLPASAVPYFRIHYPALRSKIMSYQELARMLAGDSDLEPPWAPYTRSPSPLTPYVPSLPWKLSNRLKSGA